MNLGAKSIWDIRNIEEKLNRGADGIEIQLLGNDYLCNDAFFDVSLPVRIKNQVKAIHMPLQDDFDFPIDAKIGMMYLHMVCERAKKLNFEDIHVICHYESKKKYLEHYGIYETLIKELRMVIDKYQDFTFCIENTTQIASGWENDNVDLVKDINRHNVGTCLDTCHALIIEELGNKAEGIGGLKKVTLEDHFKANKDYCKHIHLCNAVRIGDEFGVGKGHGVPFTSHKDMTLQRIKKLMKKYKYNADVVFEVQEEDYLNSKNYSLIKSQYLGEDYQKKDEKPKLSLRY